eukprot:6188184-Pleurochrysis_carterae.AAC.5
MASCVVCGRRLQWFKAEHASWRRPRPRPSRNAWASERRPTSERLASKGWSINNSILIESGEKLVSRKCDTCDTARYVSVRRSCSTDGNGSTPSSAIAARDAHDASLPSSPQRAPPEHLAPSLHADLLRSPRPCASTQREHILQPFTLADSSGC